MAITQEIKDKISEYEPHYSSTEILDSLAASGKYPDVSEKIKLYRQHYGDNEVLASLKNAPVENTSPAISSDRGIEGMTPDQLNALVPHLGQGNATGIGSPQVNQLQQNIGMGIQEYVPQIGQLAGAAGGAAVTKTPQGAIAGGGLGRAFGENAVNPMMRAIGFQPQEPGILSLAQKVPGQVLQGAAETALQEIPGGIATRIADKIATLPSGAKTPSDILNATILPDRSEMIANARALRDRSRDLMQSAMKPPQSVARTTEDQSRIMDTLARGKYQPDVESANRLSTNIDGLEMRVDNVLEKMAKSNTQIPKQSIIRQLELDQKRFIAQSGSKKLGNEYAKAIQDEIDAMKDMPDMLDPITVQSYKKDLNSKTRGAWDNMEDPILEARKSLASAYRRSLENVNPQIGVYNRQMMPLIEAETVLDRAIGRIKNTNQTGLPTQVALTGDTSNPLTWLNLAKRAMEQPGIKATRAANKLSAADDLNYYANRFDPFKQQYLPPQMNPAIPQLPAGQGFELSGEPFTPFPVNKSTMLPGTLRPQLPAPELSGALRENIKSPYSPQNIQNINFQKESAFIPEKIRLLVEDALNTPAYLRTGEQKAILNSVQQMKNSLGI